MHIFELQFPTMIGGVGKIVEVDESAFAKAKFNRGRTVKKNNVWVFGKFIDFLG